ncbi:Protein of unknown function [Gryllus bimaculatus]|nr:Protein of unknown function [Gryllus bimaculatus]
MRLFGYCSSVSHWCGFSLRNASIYIAEMSTLFSFGTLMITFASLGRTTNHHFVYDYKAIVLAHCVPLVLGSFQFLCSLLLAYGVLANCILLQEKYRCVMLWVIYMTAQTIMIFMLTIALSIYATLEFMFDILTWGYLIFFIGTIYCLVCRYFIIVVYSYYKDLKNSTPQMQLQATVLNNDVIHLS